MSFCSPGRVAVAVAVTGVVSGHALAAFDVVEKTVPQLAAAYASGAATVADVVGQYLARINKYDDSSVGVNAVGQINPNLTTAVQQTQALINSGATTAQYPLLGVPVLVKDSFDVAGMITTNGVSVLNGSASAGSTTLTARADAASVASLKAAGAIILGKTNMSTMAYSFSGIDNAHGVVRNPYNFNRTPGGSSSGSGAAAASNFAMLTMGGETGGSIRIPSTYNALVGLKTSAGLIDPGGTWPLLPSRDVVGPMGRTVTDVAASMNALVRPSATNLWNGTPFYSAGFTQPGAVGTGLGEGTPSAGTRPADYTSFLSTTALVGKVIAVPNSMNGTGTQYDGTVNSRIVTRFRAALTLLQAQGATIKYVDVPAQSLYYRTLGANVSTTAGLNDKTGAAIPYPTTTAGGTTPSNTWSSFAAAYYYQQQIAQYGDPKIKNLRDFANALSAGSAAGTGSPYSTLGGVGAPGSISTLAGIWEAGNAKGFGDANGDGVLDNPDAQKALAAFARVRQDYVNDFMSVQGIDAFVAPTMGSLAPLFANDALRDPGVSLTDPYAGGTAALMGRLDMNILGLPALTVPTGTAGDGSLWTGMQFYGRLGGEATLLGLGYDYEQATLWRMAPNLDRFIPEPATLATLACAAVFVGRRRA